MCFISYNYISTFKNPIIIQYAFLNTSKLSEPQVNSVDTAKLKAINNQLQNLYFFQTRTRKKLDVCSAN